MNRVTIIGNLVRDPEVRETTNSCIARMTVAINEGYGEKKRTNYIPVVAFGKTAENCEKYTEKGKRIAVEGRIQTGSYEDKGGRTVKTTDVIADRIEFIDFKGGETKSTGFKAESPMEDFAAIDGDCPF